MKRNLVFMTAILLAAAVLIVVKTQLRQPRSSPEQASARPAVIMVADLREENEPGDNCAEIIHLVHEAQKSGVLVSEIMPNSDSPLLRQYRVTVNPTVLVLGSDGREISRFEGEETSTVKAIRARLREMESNR